MLLEIFAEKIWRYISGSAERFHKREFQKSARRHTVRIFHAPSWLALVCSLQHPSVLLFYFSKLTSQRICRPSLKTLSRLVYFNFSRPSRMWTHCVEMCALWKRAVNVGILNCWQQLRIVVIRFQKMHALHQTKFRGNAALFLNSACSDAYVYDCVYLRVL